MTEVLFALLLVLAGLLVLHYALRELQYRREVKRRLGEVRRGTWGRRQFSDIDEGVIDCQARGYTTDRLMDMSVNILEKTLAEREQRG